MVTRISEDLDLDVLVAVVTDFIEAHDGLRTWFDRHNPEFTRHIVDSTDIAFVATGLPFSVDGTDWTSGLRRHFEAVISPFEWPGSAVAVIPECVGFNLVFAADHAFSDGISQMLGALELADRYRQKLSGRLYGAEPSGSSVEYAMDERIRADDAHDLYPYWEHAMAETGFKLPELAFDLGTVPGQRYCRQLHDWTLLDRQQTRAFDTMTAQYEATMSEAIFSALALAQYELTGREHYWTLNVLATRFGARFARTQGWLCNFVPVSFTLPAHTNFSSTLSAARSALDRGRMMSLLPAQIAVERLLRSGRGSELVVREPSFVTLLDLRRPSAAEAPDADTRIFSADGTTSTVSMWVVRDEFEYSLGIGFPDTPTAWRQLSDYVRRLRHILAAIAITGDYCLENAATVTQESST